MSNKVLITNSQKAVKVPSGLRILIRRACNAVLEYEHFDRPAEISVTFVDNAAIAELNNQYRNKPMPTDVLSFPLGEDGKYDIDENNGCMMLGDIVTAWSAPWSRQSVWASAAAGGGFSDCSLHAASAGLRPRKRRSGSYAYARKRRGCAAAAGSAPHGQLHGMISLCNRT